MLTEREKKLAGHLRVLNIWMRELIEKTGVDPTTTSMNVSHTGQDGETNSISITLGLSLSKVDEILLEIDQSPDSVPAGAV